MRSDARLPAGVALVAAALALPVGVARAEERPEPSYGRLEGDVALVVGAGVVAAPRGPRAAGELRLRYLESVGLFASYEDGPLVGSGAEPGRVVAVGLELRPLFLARWLTGREAQRARFDLVVDSLGLELAATFAQPAGTAFGSSAGLQAGLGVEFPLLRGATGPWVGLHGGVRWSDDALASGAVTSADDRGVYLALTFQWHQVALAHLVDVGDGPPR